MEARASLVERPPAEPLSFVSRDRSALHGALWIDPHTLTTPEGAARALRALTDFEAYSAAMRAFLVNLVGRQIAEEPLEAREGQPTRLGGEMAHAATVSEVALLQNTSEAAAARAVNFADRLVDKHPAVHDALFAGDITEAHAKVIVDQASTLPDEAAELLGIEALNRLHTRKGHRRTPGELRAVVKALRERLHPESIVSRRVRAAADRGVWVQPEDDGMCTLTALLPAEVGLAAYRRIDAIAHAARGAAGESRTMPQLRADAFVRSLFQAGSAPTHDGAAPPHASPAPAAPEPAQAAPEPAPEPAPAAPVPVPVPEGLADLVRAQIVVHIPAAVLLGASDDAAELEGYGVIDAHTARELAAAAPAWQRIWDDEDCVPVKLGRTAYRPPEPLRRFIRFRDGVCLVPGCTCAAHRAEVDHTIEWQDGGTTDADNLALLCPKHHAMKSLALFMLRKKAREEGRDGSAPLDGDLVWTTLLGFEHPAEPLERNHILTPLGNTPPPNQNPPQRVPVPTQPEPEPPPPF